MRELSLKLFRIYLFFMLSFFLVLLLYRYVHFAFTAFQLPFCHSCQSYSYQMEVVCLFVLLIRFYDISRSSLVLHGEKVAFLMLRELFNGSSFVSVLIFLAFLLLRRFNLMRLQQQAMWE